MMLSYVRTYCIGLASLQRADFIRYYGRASHSAPWSNTRARRLAFEARTQMTRPRAGQYLAEPCVSPIRELQKDRRATTVPACCSASDEEPGQRTSHCD